MWIVEKIPQLFRNCFWFFRGSTCQKRHSICFQGPHLPQVVEVEEELVLLVPSTHPPATWEEDSTLWHH